MKDPEVKIDYKAAHEPTQEELADLQDFLMGGEADLVESELPPRRADEKGRTLH